MDRDPTTPAPARQRWRLARLSRDGSVIASGPGTPAAPRFYAWWHDTPDRQRRQHVAEVPVRRVTSRG